MPNQRCFMSKGALWRWIQVSADVGIKHPVHLLPEDSHCERIQRLMLVTPRSESVREAEKVGLVDSIEHLDDGTLNDFVLQARDAKRSLSSVRLRDVCSPRGPCPVRSPVQSGVQISKILFEVLAILLPCHT